MNEPGPGQESAGQDSAGDSPPRRRLRLLPRRRWLRRLVVGIGALVVISVAAGIVAVTYVSGHQHLEPASSSPQPTVAGTVFDGVRSADWYVQQGVNLRRVSLAFPAEQRPGERLPAVVVLHGLRGNPGEIGINAGWFAAVAARRFIAVLPYGVAQSWNARGCCRPAQLLGIDDVAFLDLVVRDTSARPEVDSARVFMVGQSNGGMMTTRYLCDHAARLAGAASVTGINMAGCQPSDPIPLLQVSAEADEVLPYAGGRTTTSFLFSSVDPPPVPQTVAATAEAMGCDPPVPDLVDGAVTTRRWIGCRVPGQVRLDSIAGARHLWPRGDPYDATSEVLDFFAITRS